MSTEYAPEIYAWPFGEVLGIASSEGLPTTLLALAVLVALVTVWTAIVSSYETKWQIGFFVGTFGAWAYAIARTWAAWQRRQVSRVTPAVQTA